MRVGLLLLCLAAMAWPALARQELYFVKPAPPKHCDLRTARTADARTVAYRPESAPRRCLKLSGILVGRFFFADLDAYSRAGGGLPDSDDVDEGRAGVLGLYGSDEVMRNLPDRPVRVVIAGLVRSCESLRGDGAMSMGYCHYTDGGYIAVGEMELGEPFRPQRLVSDDDRARVGNLRPLPPESPAAQSAVPRVRDWLAAVRARDVARLAHLERQDTDARTPASFRYFFGGVGWRWLRAAGPDIPIKVFRVIDDPDDTVEDPNPSDDFLVACVCRQDDCGGLWPITVRDAGLNPDRPYACVQLDRLKDDPDWDLDAPFDGRSLREPLRSAAR